MNKAVAQTVAKSRAHDLDGIRGWAALSVVIFHLCSEAFGHRYPIFRGTLFTTLFNGHFDVAIFFVLSGQALSLPFFARKDICSVRNLAIKRYPRLTIPIIFSCLLSVVVLAFVPELHIQAAEVVQSQQWLGQLLTGVRNDVGAFLYYCLIGVYGHPQSEYVFNPFLWTMRIEMLGSFILFSLLCCVYLLPRMGWICALGVGLVSLKRDPFLCCFVFGMALAKAREMRLFDRIQRFSYLSQFAAGGLLIAGLCIARNPSDWATMLGSCVALLAIHMSSGLTWMFQSSLFRILGKMSFPIYLVQLAIICSFTSWAILYLDHRNSLTFLNSMVVITASLVLVLLLAWCFLLVEIFTRKAEKFWLALVLRWIGALGGSKRTVVVREDG